MGGTGWGKVSVLKQEKKRPETWPAVIKYRFSKGPVCNLTPAIETLTPGGNRFPLFRKGDSLDED